MNDADRKLVPPADFVLDVWASLPPKTQRRMALDAIRAAAQKAAEPVVAEALRELVPMEVRAAVAEALREGWTRPGDYRTRTIRNAVAEMVADAVVASIRRHEFSVAVELKTKEQP